jgi:hypothetical protein
MAAGEITGAEAAEAMRPIQLLLETLVVEMRENRIAEMVKRKRGRDARYSRIASSREIP